MNEMISLDCYFHLAALKIDPYMLVPSVVSGKHVFVFFKVGTCVGANYPSKSFCQGIVYYISAGQRNQYMRIAL